MDIDNSPTNKAILKSAFIQYIKEGKMLDIWFVKYGKPYFFLFKKSLKVTNIQFAELISLIRSYAFFKDTSSKPANKLQFLSIQQFNASIKEVVDVFLFSNSSNLDDKVIDEVSNALVDIYGELLDHTIVVDTLFTSCAVYLPPNIDIDIKLICGLSGYIHSCGTNISIRNVDKFEKQVLDAALENYLSKLPEGKKVFFAIYAHEDFTEYDRHIASELINGLDNVKIYEEKFFMGKLSLVKFISELGSKYSEKILTAFRGDYRKHIELLNDSNNNCLRDRSLWLIIDRSVKNNEPEPGDKRYYNKRLNSLRIRK